MFDIHVGTGQGRSWLPPAQAKGEIMQINSVRLSLMWSIYHNHVCTQVWVFEHAYIHVLDYTSIHVELAHLITSDSMGMGLVPSYSTC